MGERSGRWAARLAILAAALSLGLFAAGPAFADCGGGGSTVGASGSGTVGGSGSSGGSGGAATTGGGGGGGLLSILPPSSPPPPPPPQWVGLGTGNGCPQASQGPTCNLYVYNPICALDACQPNLPANCVDPNGLGLVKECPPPPPAAKTPPTQFSGRNGATISYSESSSTIQVAYWQVDYAGHTYQFEGAPTLDTGYVIRDDCTGQPTSGTVSFWLTSPPDNIYQPPQQTEDYGAPSSGWQWEPNASPPPPPYPGPYTTSFTVPACSPADQLPAQVSLAPKSGPSVENGYAVTANGSFQPFTFQPVVVGGVDQELAWSGGTATLGPQPPYSPTVDSQIGQSYPRWQTEGPTAPSGYGLYGSSGQPNPQVQVAFHAPSNAGQPYTLTVSGTYDAYWSYWYIDVLASAVSNETDSTVTAENTVYYTCTTTSTDPSTGQTVTTSYSCPQTYTESFTWQQPNWQITGASDQVAPSDVHSGTFPVSATVHVKVVFPSGG